MDRRSVVKGLVSFFFGGALTSPAWAKDNGLLLPNIASLSVIPPRLLTLVSSFKGSANGQMYIGRADTDPLVSANQIPVYLEREDGSRMLVSQPILLDESSAPRINNEGGRLVTLESYALAVHDREGGQQFYISDVRQYEPYITNLYIDEKLSELSDSTGADLIGYKNATVGEELGSLEFIKSTADIYYATFFETNTNAVNLVTSHDGLNWSDPAQLSDGKKSIAGRDPSICFFKNNWFVAVTENLVENYDMLVYTSKDLINWKRVNVKLNGNEAICSRKKTWDKGTRGADKLWAPELIVESDELYVIISIYLGYDQSSSPTAKSNYFGTYIAKCIDINEMRFSEPSRIDYHESDGSLNKYSRIDADIVKDTENNKYLLAAKRENYGVIDVFHSTSFLGPYEYVSTVSMSTGGADIDYLMRSGIEAPCLFQLKTGEWAMIFDPNDTFDGITYITSRDGFFSFSKPQKLRLPKFRHGTIKSGRYEGLTAKGVQDLYRCKTATSAAISSQVIPNNFIRIKENCSIIPQSDTVYWANASYKVTLIAPNRGDCPRSFYFCVRSSDRSVVLSLNGAIVGGSYDLGWGISNERIIEFFYDGLDNKYRCEMLEVKSYNGSHLSASAGGNAINAQSASWIPQHGMTYTISTSDGTCVIHSLPNMPVGTYFNVVIQSAEDAFIGLIIKAGNGKNNLGLTADFAYRGGVEQYDGRIIRIEKGSELWFVTK
ncbi:TPA: family 43 glycosylhydrolase [Serratia marcescens]|uniref:phage tailspike protein n=1 Tax=Serratia marcescens TaxID=615 RepID=UPI00093FC99E|nr:phage tailspike protein [Serratia marcescens]EGT0501569.1 family 43 glycosylhydrolase [Serratia marcescens]EHT9829127.1 family 43 glycosylhydrolase [Serratia marcescens]EIU0970376.1 family 43 glycosylhydrolase [Serratia marcescens]EMB7755227.1 family 43 glycosylhydrolase [Serratia marcescens]MDP8631009.1 phage tailspike protein [Serratia marcescens]